MRQLLMILTVITSLNTVKNSGLSMNGYSGIEGCSLWTKKDNLPPVELSNIEEEDKGLNVLTLNPSTNSVTFRKLFPLGHIYSHYLDLLWHVKNLHIGSIVVMLVSSSGMIGLRDAAEEFKNMGSLMSEYLQPSSHWIWIFLKGGKTILETTVSGSYNSVYGHLEMLIQEAKSCMEKDKFEICNEVNGLGSFCDSPNSLMIDTIPLPQTDILDQIPIIITGGNRIQYLNKVLQNIQLSPGFRKHKLTIYLGDTNENVIKFLKYLNINFIEISVTGEGNRKLFEFYRQVFEHVYRNHKYSPAVIFLDEDVEVAPDFFSLMSQMIPILLEDSSLYCASGFNPIRSEKSKGRLDIIHRVTTQVLWGFALTRDFIGEALSLWPKDRRYEAQFDFWIYLDVAGERECLVPEVGRTKHFGIGLNSDASDMELYYLKTTLPTAYNIQITNKYDISGDKYDKYLLRVIKKAEVMNGNPCSDDFLSDLSYGSYVFYYRLKANLDGSYKYENYFWIGECLGFFTKLDSGWHNGVTVYPVNPAKIIYFVGTPFYPNVSEVVDLNSVYVWDVNELSEYQLRKMRLKVEKRSNSVMTEIKSKYQKQNSIRKLFS